MTADPGGDAFATDMAVSRRQFGIWLIGSDGRGRVVDQNIGSLVTELIGLV